MDETNGETHMRTHWINDSSQQTSHIPSGTIQKSHTAFKLINADDRILLHPTKPTTICTYKALLVPYFHNN